MSIRLLGDLTLLRSLIGAENSRYSLNPSDAKHKPIAWSPAFFRVWAFLSYSGTLWSLGLKWAFVITLVLILRYSIVKRSIILQEDQASDEEQDESPESGENEPLLRSRDQSEPYTGVI